MRGGLDVAECGTHQPIRTGSGRRAASHPAFKWVNMISRICDYPALPVPYQRDRLLEPRPDPHQRGVDRLADGLHPGRRTVTAGHFSM